VKYHLFRDKAHKLPIYCPNCFAVFEAESLRDEHIREIQCVKKPLAKWEGITESQRRQLSKRSSSKRSPKANWYEVFKVLVPGDSLPKSPYIDTTLSGELGAFREHLLVEGPRNPNDLLTSQLSGELRPYLEELQSLYDSLYEESIERLCESWSAQCPSIKDQPMQVVRTEPGPLRTPVLAAATDTYPQDTLRLEFFRQGAEPITSSLTSENHTTLVQSPNIPQPDPLFSDAHFFPDFAFTTNAFMTTNTMQDFETSLHPVDTTTTTQQSSSRNTLLDTPLISIDTSAEGTFLDESFLEPRTLEDGPT
jgi:hypothetical protein